jgi:hypothetical protein
VIRLIVAIGRVSHVDDSVEQQQARSVRVHQRIEAGRSDRRRRRNLLRAVGNVEGVEPVEEVSALLRLRFHIHGPGAWIDHGCTGHADRGNQVWARIVHRTVGRGGPGSGAMRGIQQGHLPERVRVCASVGVGVEGIHAVVLRRHIHHLVLAS